MFSCVFCEVNTVYTTYLCNECRELKHTKLLYKDRFNEVIKNVLLRTDDKQEYKIKDEIKKDIENKQMVLRSNDKKK